MEQFSSTAYIESDLLGLEKTSMTYPFRCLLNERIDLAKYGDAVRHIYFAPVVSQKAEGFIEPYCRYKADSRELEIRYKLDVDHAVAADLAAYFQMMVHGLVDGITVNFFPSDFDILNFKADLFSLDFGELKKYWVEA